MKTVRELMLSPRDIEYSPQEEGCSFQEEECSPQEKIIDTIWNRWKHNPRLNYVMVKEKNEEALRMLTCIPAASSKEILLVYMEYESLGADGVQYVPTFRYFKRKDMENFCRIPKYDKLCREGIDLIDFDTISPNLLDELDDIKIRPYPLRVRSGAEAPIKSWDPSEVTAHINAPVYAFPAFSELDLAVEFLLFYRGLNRNLDDDPPAMAADPFARLEQRKCRLKSKLALYQLMRAVHAQLKAHP